MTTPFSDLTFTPLTTAGLGRAKHLLDQVEDEIALHHEVAHEVSLLLPASHSPDVAGPFGQGRGAIGLGMNTLEQAVANHLQSASQNLLLQMQHNLQARQNLLAQRHAQRMAEGATKPTSATSPQAAQAADVVIDVQAREVTEASHTTAPVPTPQA